MADASFDEVTAADILVVPGGFGTRPLMKDAAHLDWVRAVHETTTWTTSVCTGSLLLGAAGLLDGLDATTHWASYDVLASTGAIPTAERVVERGKIITAAGVSSGIDMALTLTAHIGGDDMAKAIQLSIEYDPQPPFDCGSPAKAGRRVRRVVARHQQREASGLHLNGLTVRGLTPSADPRPRRRPPRHSWGTTSGRRARTHTRA